MKKYLVLLFIVFCFRAFAQEPAMLSLTGIGGSGVDQVSNQVTKTSDGGFIICISSTSAAGSGDIDSFCDLSGERSIFLKYNSDAMVLEWTKCLLLDGDTSLEYIFPTSDGGFVFGGNYYTTGWGMYICKQDALGNIVWSHGYSKGNDLSLISMITTGDGGYIMAGESSYVDTNVIVHYGSFMDADIFVMKVDSIGNKVWGKVVGGTGDESVGSVIMAPNNGCYIVGGTTSNDHDCTGNHGGYDAYLAMLDSNGNILWHNDLGGGGDDIGNYGCADGKNGILIAANSSSSDGDVMHHITAGMPNIWVLEVDSGNHILWNNCYGGGGGEMPNDICKATDGSIWIAGSAGTKGEEVDTVYGHGEAWFVHADSTGNFLNAKVLGSNQQDQGSMVYPLSNGNVIVGGYYGENNESFASLESYGSFPIVDAFLAVFAPWNQTGVSQVSLVNNIVKIYPNPATEQVTIESQQKGNYEAIVTDVLGTLIYKAHFVDKIKISVNSWQTGMYYVRITNDQGYRSVQKLIVQ
jgi:type IX secretion system substrate protein